MDIREKVVVLGAVVAVIIGFLGCKPAAQVQARNAADEAAYSFALDACEEKGKAAKSYQVYEVCAIDADRKYRRQP